MPSLSNQQSALLRIPTKTQSQKIGSLRSPPCDLPSNDALRQWAKTPSQSKGLEPRKLSWKNFQDRFVSPLTRTRHRYRLREKCPTPLNNPNAPSQRIQHAFSRTWYAWLSDGPARNACHAVDEDCPQQRGPPQHFQCTKLQARPIWV
jgi:hypothetical protein